MACCSVAHWWQRPVSVQAMYALPATGGRSTIFSTSATASKLAVAVEEDDAADPYDATNFVDAAPKKAHAKVNATGTAADSATQRSDIFGVERLLDRLREMGAMQKPDEEPTRVVDEEDIIEQLPAFLQVRMLATQCQVWFMQSLHLHVCGMTCAS